MNREQSVNTTDDDQESFQEIGRLIGKLFAGAIRHAAAASPEAAALLLERFRSGRGVRAVVSFEVGQIDFEWRGNDGTWRSFISLTGEVPHLLVN
jgi:hypothetical protein